MGYKGWKKMLEKNVNTWGSKNSRNNIFPWFWINTLWDPPFIFKDSQTTICHLLPQNDKCFIFFLVTRNWHRKSCAILHNFNSRMIKLGLWGTFVIWIFSFRFAKQVIKKIESAVNICIQNKVLNNVFNINYINLVIMTAHVLRNK